MEAIKIINLNQQSLPLPESFSNLNIEVMHIKSAYVWQTFSKDNYLYEYYCFFWYYILIVIFETASILSLYTIGIPIPAACSVSHLLSLTLHSVLWWYSHQRWQKCRASVTGFGWQRKQRIAVWKYFAFGAKEQLKAVFTSLPTCKPCHRSVLTEGANTTHSVKLGWSPSGLSGLRNLRLFSW